MEETCHVHVELRKALFVSDFNTSRTDTDTYQRSLIIRGEKIKGIPRRHQHSDVSVVIRLKAKG